MAEILYSIMSNLAPSYGGAIYVQSDQPLTVNFLVLSNITANVLFNFSLDEDKESYGSPAIFYSGSAFHGSFICASQLMTSGQSFIASLITNDNINELNHTCLSFSKCTKGMIQLHYGHGLAHDINSSICQIDLDCVSIHFGSYLQTYYMFEGIVSNCSAARLFGQSCGSNDVQTCERIVFVDNSVTTYLLSYWGKSHRIFESYFINNEVSTVTKLQGATLVLENCYLPHFEGDFENSNSLTSMNIDINDYRRVICSINFKKAHLSIYHSKWSVISFALVSLPLFTTNKN